MIQKLLGTHFDLWPQVTHVEIQLNPIKKCVSVLVLALDFADILLETCNLLASLK